VAAFASRGATMSLLNSTELDCRSDRTLPTAGMRKPLRSSFSCSLQCFAVYHPDDGQFGLCLFQRLGDGLLGVLMSARATSYFAITAAGMMGTPPSNFSPTLSASTCGISHCLIYGCGVESSDLLQRLGKPGDTLAYLVSGELLRRLRRKKMSGRASHLDFSSC
jgi:hypothetical protein